MEEEVAATFRDTEDLFPEGSLFMSLRAIGYLLTHATCLLSVRQKKEILRSKDIADIILGTRAQTQFG